ncbi:MAG: DUF4149 domain-containing protein [gamma proteobacterium symbiont of Bathyaustriella thionipta]|nr:DUF4149 domain-containing protein [gamma proteobacterium symbiont of Bathyaustriella thionipta]MCU7948958.1 DUF4149 domain-containing protein [gamma proteobacterium symbiont of Bathyaustriella thionipta]MCU7953960.1 DUF4149 domain-containing protein [gamma proteobacterium symbiont of Bathyaustriella thionipta]MCU7955503.1 DUF4149 domain-containing protein [gamma proteobacterium symbiont of Bathyaustriella thionipta]MCU7967092.1 DUF4149 domain-containing protein [gamma proteobacterium symbion
MTQYFSQTSGEKILLTLWIGSLWTVGFLVVPTLFGTLEDKQLAGMLAGKMFTAASYIGLFSGLIIVLTAAKQSERFKTNKRIWLVALMLLIVIIGEFIIQPQMADLKQLGLLSGSETSRQFDQLHLIGTALYMLNSLLGLILIIYQPQK